MGTRYNVSHIPEADVKEAWANYSKYSYYYSTEIEKAKETLKSTLSTARSRLIARGITEDNPQFQREMDRITNIAQADVATLQKGKKSLETGAIRGLLTTAPISKYSAGNYQKYAADILSARRRIGVEDITEKDEYSGEIMSPIGGGGLAQWEITESGDYQRVTPPGEEPSRRPETMSAELYQEMSKKAATPIQSMEQYYTGIWGAYDPHFDVKKEREAKSEEAARGKAGSRAYTIQTQPKGRPGGGKPGNPFMQTGREIAQEKAPTEDREKAWWA